MALLHRVSLLLAVLACAAACSRAREYELRGQVLAVDKERQQLTVKHEDIVGFMPAMTMPFRVEDREQLEPRVPGELIRATLVVGDREVHLEDVERTGEAPLTEAPPPGTFDLLEPGEAVPDEPFVDQSGTSRRLSDWRGKAVAVTFIYTRCPLPDFCPRMDQHFSAVQKEVAGDPALRGRVHLVSISFDPDFDRPNVLKAHAARAGADGETWSFVTGARDDIDRFASRCGVSIIREDRTAQESVHNLSTAVSDRRGRRVKVFSGNDWTPAELLHELRASVDAR
jgi:protein SCO1/2